MTIAGGTKRFERGYPDLINEKEALSPDFDWSRYTTPELLNLRHAECYSEAFRNVLHAELAKRPHMRTKAEAKRERQEKAKRQRS